MKQGLYFFSFSFHVDYDSLEVKKNKKVLSLFFKSFFRDIATELKP